MEKSRYLTATLCSLFLLNGCASDPIITSVIEIQRIPASLTVACPITELGNSTYQGAIELALALKGDLVECNRRLEDIRRWGAQ